MNSHRLPGKGRRMRPIMGHTMHYRRMIITLQPGCSSSFLSNLNHESQSMLASSQSWDPHDPFLDCLSEDRKKLSCQCKVRLVQNSESRREEGTK
ncbi:unnamed protein product [Linum tenue]|uniref:Uncharacterized protein n=1 Tax=Linum tenue TaxID=586396 RepID=A0AAV0S4N8_9ROSI|nr:unnamed protein product [Linum tenue]